MFTLKMFTLFIAGILTLNLHAAEAKKSPKRKPNSAEPMSCYSFKPRSMTGVRQVDLLIPKETADKSFWVYFSIVDQAGQQFTNTVGCGSSEARKIVCRGDDESADFSLLLKPKGPSSDASVQLMLKYIDFGDSDSPGPRIEAGGKDPLKLTLPKTECPAER